jgi:hypothetical protein
VVGFNGIAVTTLAAAFPKLTKYRLNVGGRSGAIKPKSERIANRVIYSVALGKDKLFYSGLTTLLFERSLVKLLVFVTFRAVLCLGVTIVFENLQRN